MQNRILYGKIDPSLYSYDANNIYLYIYQYIARLLLVICILVFKSIRYLYNYFDFVRMQDAMEFSYLI